MTEQRKPSLVKIARQANKAGIPVARYECKPDGTIVIVTGEPEQCRTSSDWDEVLKHEH